MCNEGCLCTFWHKLIPDSSDNEFADDNEFNNIQERTADVAGHLRQHSCLLAALYARQNPPYSMANRELLYSYHALLRLLLSLKWVRTTNGVDLLDQSVGRVIARAPFANDVRRV